MSQSNIQGRNYARNAYGLWTPVGYGTGDTQIPVALTNPNIAAMGVYAGLTGYGAQRVTTEPSVLFHDPFDGTLDTQKWVTGGTVAPTALGGRAIFDPGTAVSASSSLSSTASFCSPGSSYLGLGMMQTFETISASVGSVGYLNTHRFWGFAVVAGTWVAAYTASASTGPILHGYGFEIDIDGNLYAVVYDNGIRTRPDAVGSAAGEKRLNLTRAIFNGETHQFTIVIRPDAVFWYVDGQELPAAVLTFRTASYPIPDIQTLPVRIHTINHTTAPTGTTVHRPAAVAVADTGGNNHVLSDASYPWRRAGVTDVNSIVGAGRSSLREQTYGSALNVNTNALQLATYHVNRSPQAGVAPSAPATPAMVANTPKIMLTGWHAASSTKTVRIRRIRISAAFAQTVTYVYEVYRTNVAPTGGTTVVSRPSDSADPASDTSWMFQSTVAITTQLVDGSLVDQAVIATNGAMGIAAGHGEIVLYDWQENGQTKPLTMRAGVLEGFCITVKSTGTGAPDSVINVTYTEE